VKVLLKWGKETCAERKRDEQSQYAGGEEIVAPIQATVHGDRPATGGVRAPGWCYRAPFLVAFRLLVFACSARSRRAARPARAS